jgi:TonB-dependent SusC/RagA subfamily outer membrane receptor
MRKSIITLGLLVCAITAARAQSGAVAGGRGAGPDWARPHGTMCIDVDSIIRVEVLKGAAASAQYGVDASNGIVIIYTKPGPGLRNCTAPSGSGDDPLAKLFLPPDLVMSHQQAIALTELQRQSIQTNMLDTQKKLLDQQFKLQSEVEKLQQLLKSAKPDEAKVLDEMDKVLGAERDIKRAQLSLMVKLKNSLTEQQQSQLETLRKQAPQK